MSEWACSRQAALYFAALALCLAMPGFAQEGGTASTTSGQGGGDNLEGTASSPGDLGDTFATRQGKGIGVGPGARLFPAIEIAVVHDDNFFFDPNDEASATGLLLRPALGLSLTTTRTKTNFNFSGEVAQFSGDDVSDEDDYTDFNLSASSEFQANSRNLFGVQLARRDDHDPFGQRRTEGSALTDRELDEFHTDALAASYRFGASDARFNFELSGSTFSKEYDTNTEFTRFLDFTADGLAGTLLYNYSPKTTLGLSYGVRDIEFDATPPGFIPRDADEERILLGIEWLATGKTTGRIRVGHVDREPDDSRRDDFSAVDWEVEIVWTPRERTRFTFETGRRTNESFLFDGDFINTQEAGIVWHQEWTSRLSTRLGGRYLDQDFEGTTRQDDYAVFDASFAFLLVRGFSLKGGYVYSDRDSTFNNRDFSKNLFSLGLAWRP